MKADLHIHSRCSDGSLTVEELIDAAKSIRLDFLSITDHDTTDGQLRAIQYGLVKKIPVIAGIEISAIDPESGSKVHILGYGYSLPAPNLNQLCMPLLKRRHDNTLWQLKKLQDYGIEVNESEIREEAGESKWLYKQHIMSVLVKKGLTDSIYSPLYRDLFKGEGPAAREIEYVHYEDAISAVKADGGFAVLAHPGQQQNFFLIEQMVEQGLEGLELNHSDNSPQDKLTIMEAAHVFELVLTGGSDFHGTYGSSARLGGIVAPEHFLDSFRKLINQN